MIGPLTVLAPHAKHGRHDDGMKETGLKWEPSTHSSSSPPRSLSCLFKVKPDVSNAIVGRF